MDENDEAGFVGTRIEDWHAEGVDYKDFAIFYRTNAQSRIFEEAFRAANIPYQIVGGVGFYDRMEVKDLLGIPPCDVQSQRLHEPTDGSLIYRAASIITPKGSVPQPSNGSAISRCVKVSRSLKRSSALTKSDTISRGIQTKVQRFAEAFDDFDATTLPADALDYVLKITGYLKNLDGQNSIEAQNRVENIEELINAVIEYEHNAPEPSLLDYLENVALIADIDTMETDSIPIW